MKIPLTLLALGLAALISVPASAEEDSTPGSAYSSESTPVDTGSARSMDQEPPAGAPSSEAGTPEAAPALGGNDSLDKSEDKPASAP